MLDEEAICEAYRRQDTSVRKLAKLHQTNFQAMYRLLKRRGVIKRSSRKRRYPEDEIAAAYADRRKSSEGIKAQFHIGSATLYRIVDEHGMARRRNGSGDANDNPDCPGYPLYCAFCPLTPRCDEWHCAACQYRAACPCCQVKTAGWHVTFRKWQTARDKRHGTAARMRAGIQPDRCWTENNDYDRRE